MKKDQSLLHYGILGMHWGIRRTQAELGHPEKQSLGDRLKSRKRERLLEKAPRKKTDISSMSDEDLQNLVNRLQLEKRYNDLMKELHPDKNHAAKEFVKNVSFNALKNISENVVSSVAKMLDSSYKNTKELEKLQTLEGIEVSKYNAELAKARLAAIKAGSLDATKAQPLSGKGKKNNN